MEDIAKAVHITKTQLNRYLGREFKVSEEERRTEEIVERLRPIIEQLRNIPDPVQRLIEDLYGPAEVSSPTAVVTDPFVLRMRSMMADRLADVSRLYGLHMLLRLSNEFVRTPDGSEQRGWSLSLVNLPPKHIQEGVNHPVFKLSQTSRARHPITIQGIALVRRDRLTLQGIEATTRYSLSATVVLPHESGWQTYHSGGEPLNGVMLGLTSSKACFGCLFMLFPIPKTRLAEEATAVETETFRMLHQDAKAATGVRTREETLAVLRGLGVKATDAQVMQLDQRSRDEPLFTLF